MKKVAQKTICIVTNKNIFCINKSKLLKCPRDCHKCQYFIMYNVTKSSFNSFWKKKMNLWTFTTLCSSLVMFAAIQAAPQSPPASPGVVSNTVTNSLRAFNRKLYLKLSEGQTGNFVFSPFSLHMAFSLLSLGAPLESKTRSELVPP